MKSLLLVLVLTITYSISAQQQNCKVLLLQSGGDKAAYQAGVLQAFMSSADIEDFQYDVISGVNSGALNSFFMNLYPKGQEQEMVTFLTNFWQNLVPSDLYVQWPGGWNQGLFSEAGVFDNTPTIATLSNYSNMTLQKDFYTGMINVENGSFVSMSSQNLSRSDLITVLQASLAQPFMYPYVMFDGNAYMDGASTHTIDAASPINYCRSLGVADENIIVDVILTDASHQVSQQNSTTGNAVENGIRALQLVFWLQGYQDMFHLFLDYATINFRHVVMPTQDLSQASLYPYDYTPAEVQNFINIGISDGQNALQQGPTAHIAMIREHVTERVKRMGRATHRQTKIVEQSLEM